jgi:hypothetical protein
VPEAIVIAGPNGAGKTTFARELLPALYPEVDFLNVDEVQTEALPFEHPVAAGRELLRRLAEKERRRDSFAIETTLSSTTYASRRADMKLPNRTDGGAFIGAWRSSSRCTRRSWTSGIIGPATKGDSVLASTRRDERMTPKLAILLKAARRATWDALHGPRHLRSGRFRLNSSERVGAAQGVAAVAASRRR